MVELEDCYYVADMPAFRLSKWYLDCVSESGEASIVYAGAVRWGAFRLNYSSLIESGGGSISTRQSFRDRDRPAITDGSILWRSGAFGIDGEWRADSSTLSATIFASDVGSVAWECLMPRARARIGSRVGLGYAERLLMTIPPWGLPLTTLRWGRFASATNWLVWIDWRGDFSRTLVYQDGREAPAQLIEDAEMALGDGSRLVMDTSLVLREGALGSTVLAAIPGIRDSLPGRVLRITECKWRSRARLERPGCPAVDGWAIHERVEWPT